MHTSFNLQPPGLCESAQGHHQLAHTPGSEATIPQSAGLQSATSLIGIFSQRAVDTIKQAAQLLTVAAGLLIKMLLFV